MIVQSSLAWNIAQLPNAESNVPMLLESLQCCSPAWCRPEAALWLLQPSWMLLDLWESEVCGFFQGAGDQRCEIVNIGAGEINIWCGNWVREIMCTEKVDMVAGRWVKAEPGRVWSKLCVSMHLTHCVVEPSNLSCYLSSPLTVPQLIWAPRSLK